MLDCLDLDFEMARGDEIRMPCPFHDGDNNTLSMNTDTTAFFCYKCKAAGTASDFTAHLLQISPLEATRMLKERYQPGFINPDARNTVAEVRKILEREPVFVPAQPLLDESALERFAVNWPEAWMAWQTPGWESDPACDYVFERGFAPETLANWEFGWDSLSDRITFAVRDERGRLVGFKARSVDGRRPKYLVLGDSPGRGHRYGWPCYFNSRVVYGAHRIESSIKELIVVEGEWNAIAVVTKLKSPAVAINGSNFTEHHARIIRELTERAILMLDSDKAGEMATWGWIDAQNRKHRGAVDQLKPFVSVHVVGEHESDAMDLDTFELEDIIGRAKPWTLAQSEAKIRVRS